MSFKSKGNMEKTKKSSKTKISLFILLLLAILIAIALPSIIKSSKIKACEKQGGRWEYFLGRSRGFCNLPTSDGGKECFDSEECDGRCITYDSNGSNGICSRWKFTRGCHTYFEDGSAGTAVCVD